MADEQALSGDAFAPAEVSALRAFMEKLGFVAPKPVAAAAVSPPAPPPPAAAPAAAIAPPVAPPSPVVPAVAAAPALDEAGRKQAQDAINAMVAEAFKAFGAGLAPRTQAPSKAPWPQTQREALEWARGTAEERKALHSAVNDGFKIHSVPRG